MEFAKMKKQLLQLQEKDYQNFVKALVSIETKCDDEEKLKDMYEDFMEDDTMGLLDIAPFRKMVTRASLKQSADSKPTHFMIRWVIIRPYNG